MAMSLGPMAFPEAQAVLLILKANTHIFIDIQYYRIKRKVIHEKMPSEFRMPNIFLFFLYFRRLPTCECYPE
jgi:hypothetical protein